MPKRLLDEKVIEQMKLAIDEINQGKDKRRAIKKAGRKKFNEMVKFSEQQTT